jgi:hypothetical protein
MVDIIVVTKPNTTSARTDRDSFTIANKAYLSHVSARPESFLVPVSEPYPDPDNESHYIFNYTLTLLPYQIFILPANLQTKLNESIFQTHHIYSDEDIRYLYTVLY